ncbi:MAG: hypothetical protein V1820_05330 [archaeon]
MGLSENDLKALNEQVRKILEEREKLLFDINKIEQSSTKPSLKIPEKQSRLF